MKQIACTSFLFLMVLISPIVTGRSVSVTTEDQEAQEAQGILSRIDTQYFIENKEQWHSDVLYLARFGGMDAWITKYGVNYTFYKLEEVMDLPYARKASEGRIGDKEYNLIGHRVLMRYEKHNEHPGTEGRGKQMGYYNYFIGNDKSKHATNVGLYKEVVVKDLYKGIDVRYYFEGESLRYDYVVHVGSDPSRIRFRLEGSEGVYLSKGGEVVFNTRFGETKLGDLKAYQALGGRWYSE